MSESLLTVQQFADAVGISKQAVYKGVNNQLKPFVREVNGQKMIHRVALQEVYGLVVGQPVDQPINPLKLTLQMLQAELEVKNEQLAAKDRQIEQLTALLQAMQAERNTRKGWFGKWKK